MVHRALVLALGLGDIAQGVQDLHMRNGTAFDTPRDFGTLLIGMRIGLRYNHSTESMDVGPDTPLPRSEVAWSLSQAATEPDWIADSLAPYATIELPNVSAAMQEVVNFGIQYVGYPYVWSGEWFEPSPVGYCCGYQPVGGFDCSGLTWWVMRAVSSSYDPPPREYRGWSLPQRSSAEMAASGGKVRFADLRPGDLMFYDGDGDGVVDHVDTYLGNGWSLDSGGSVGGVSIVKVDEGWYHDHFVHGRRIMK
jgi:cell wall-associated NlpC family hydrolase